MPAKAAARRTTILFHPPTQTLMMVRHLESTWPPSPPEHGWMQCVLQVRKGAFRQLTMQHGTQQTQAAYQCKHTNSPTLTLTLTLTHTHTHTHTHTKHPRNQIQPLERPRGCAHNPCQESARTGKFLRDRTARKFGIVAKNRSAPHVTSSSAFKSKLTNTCYTYEVCFRCIE
jgi:hypothetical protein